MDKELHVQSYPGSSLKREEIVTSWEGSFRVDHDLVTLRDPRRKGEISSSNENTFKISLEYELFES